MRLALVVLLLLTSTVRAAPRTVVLVGVSGPRGDAVAHALESSLAELYDLVPSSRFRAAAQRLGLHGADPEAVRRVAAVAHTDAIISGAISGGHLRFAIRDGSTGQVVAHLDYRLKGRTASSLKERIVADMVRKLELVRPQTAEVAEAPPETPPEETEAQAEPETAPEETAPTPESDVSISAHPAPRTPYGTRAVDVGVGMGVLSRGLTFNTASAPGLSTGAIYAARIDGTFYPLRVSPETARAHPVVAAFGLAVGFAQALAFDETGATGNTTSGRAIAWHILGLGRVPLGSSDTSGALVFEAGVRALKWTSSSPLEVGVPDVDYRLVDGGVAWQQPLGTPRVTLAVRGSGLIVADAGPMVSLAQYGVASGWGADGEAGLQAWLLPWLFVRASGAATFVKLNYAGAGHRLATSSTDTWVGGFFEVGSAL